MATRVGEHFLLGFRGLTLPLWLLDFERRFGLGGVILFDRDLERKGELRNIESPEQVAALCAEVHALDSRPLVFIDQEGGKVRRLKPERGFAGLPSAATFVRLNESEARAVAMASFREMAQLGIDFDLAPVVDLDLNPDNPNIGALERSFSRDASEVLRCASIQAEAARAAGLALCLKHYPGLGAARTDSHSERTDVSGTLTEDQLRLFGELGSEIPGGAILLSHGIVDEWEPGVPVAISPVAIGRLRFEVPDALLITDDIQMKGLQVFCSTEEACFRALRAGIDLICIGNNLSVHEDDCLRAAEAIAARAVGDRAFAALLMTSTARIRARKPTREQATGLDPHS